MLGAREAWPVESYWEEGGFGTQCDFIRRARGAWPAESCWEEGGFGTHHAREAWPLTLVRLGLSRS